jgi:hypothetical protein
VATVRIKRSNTAAAAPASLGDGEIAINQQDGKLFYRTAAGSVATLVSSSAASIVEYATTASFPSTGVAATLYVSTDTGKAYHWINSAVYVEFGPFGSPGAQGATGATGAAGVPNYSLVYALS